MILSSLSHHVQLNKLNSDGQEKMIFPVNTADDVLVNEGGDSLTVFLPTIDSALTNPQTQSPMFAVEKGTETVSDTVMNALLA